ncbi:hypothetical protein LX36DRAFT_71393 [Colletotrichum falcatum]|nr:hypothetical protein LX36DRAFT_71393 [Colletotrichum falcatum]
MMASRVRTLTASIISPINNCPEPLGSTTNSSCNLPYNSYRDQGKIDATQCNHLESHILYPMPAGHLRDADPASRPTRPPNRPPLHAVLQAPSQRRSAQTPPLKFSKTALSPHTETFFTLR